MGQKVSPHGLRVGVIKDWNSKWYADKKDFADYLVEDKKIRDHILDAGISTVACPTVLAFLILVNMSATGSVIVMLLYLLPFGITSWLSERRVFHPYKLAL
jgi:hypothetical protein